MKFYIMLKEADEHSISADGQNTLIKKTEDYAKDLLREAVRIEELDRQKGAYSEITSNTIMKAANYRFFYGMLHKKTPFWIKVARICSPLSCCIFGCLFDINGYAESPYKLVIALLFFAVGCFSTIVVCLKE